MSMEPLLQDVKGVLIQQKTITAHPQTHLHVLFPHPHGCTWKTPGELHRNQKLLFLSARPLHFFQHRRHWGVTLTDRRNVFLCFLQQLLLIRGFPPKTLPWPHRCGSTHSGLLHKVIIQQNSRESHGKNLLCCWKLLLHSQSTQVHPLISREQLPYFTFLSYLHNFTLDY